MEVKEIQQRKNELTRQVADLITAFNKETGTTVEDIELVNMRDGVGPASNILCNVEVVLQVMDDSEFKGRMLGSFEGK